MTKFTFEGKKFIPGILEDLQSYPAFEVFYATIGLENSTEEGAIQDLRDAIKEEGLEGWTIETRYVLRRPDHAAFVLLFNEDQGTTE